MDYLGSYTRNKALVPKEYVDAGGGGGGAAIARIPLTYTVNSERLTDFEYTAYAYPTLGICFVRGSGTLNVNHAAGTTSYTIATLDDGFSQYIPGAYVPGSLRSAKNFDFAITTNGHLAIWFNEAGAVGDTLRFAGWWYTGVEGVSGTIKYTDLDTDLQAMIDLATTAVQQDMIVTATGLAAGSNPTVSYDPATNTLSFGIPAGAKGDPGAAGSPGAAGADAKINGVNALTLSAGDGLSATQTGSTLTLALDLDNYDGGAF